MNVWHAALVEHLPDLPGQMTCEAAAYGEYYYDTHIMRWLQQCGPACAHIHMLPVYHLSLPQHNSHHGSFGRGTEKRRIDCRHYCSNVIDVWNQVHFFFCIDFTALKMVTLRDPYPLHTVPMPFSEPCTHVPAIWGAGLGNNTRAACQFLPCAPH